MNSGSADVEAQTSSRFPTESREAAVDDSAMGNSGPDNSERPTRVRQKVLMVLCLLSAVLYLDRICISAALTPIQNDLKLSQKQTSYVLMAFTLAYGLFEIPTGRWGDQLGARRVLTRISLWWSAFTALTGACTGLWSLVTVRFLFGAGEAGAFPNAARVLSRWFPDHERGRAQGIFLAASQIGGAASPYLAAQLIQTVGWRWTFAVFGCVGVVWAAGFRMWYRDHPHEHSEVNAAEVRLIGDRSASSAVHAPIPWALIRSNPSIWFLSLIMVCASFNSYIYFSWYPKYLEAARGISRIDAGLMATIALSFAAAGTLSGGYILDRLNVHSSLTRKRLLGLTAFLSSAVLLAGALASSDPWTAAVLTALSCFATQLTQPLWWTCAIGISGQHLGALFGLMNSAGVFGGMSSQYLTGALADHFGAQGFTGRAQWDPIFYINLGVLCVAGLLWAAFIFRRVEPDDTAADAG